MKVDAEALLVPQRSDAGWRLALPLIIAALAGLLALYWDTARSIVSIWHSSETYAHGYIIVPIVVYLAWKKRHELARLSPTPSLAGTALLAAAGAFWLVAAAGDVQVLQQYALVAMVPGVVIALAGWRVGLVLAFPFVFLFFAVPFGEAFVPRLMDWTADFTVAALQVSGIPVFREGNTFDLPSGRWSVVEACSGIRYLIASVTIGTLYAYLTYRKTWKRALFIALSIGVPVFANFVRAYLIVMIGHLSSMKLAVGVDHLIYGWIFFGFVILALFWLGAWWRDAPAPAQILPPVPSRATQRWHFAAAIAAVAVLAVVWPVYARHLERPETAAPQLSAPALAAGWQADSASLTDWRPAYAGAKASRWAVYRKGDQTVALYLGYYVAQRQGAELVSSQNMLIASDDPKWVRVGETGRAVPLAGHEVEARETRLHSAHQRLLVWDWYRVAGWDTANPYLAKALLARDRLLDRDDDSVAIILVAPYETRPDAARQALREFTTEMLPSIHATLASAAKRTP